jgi:hypothetical protein
MRKEELISPLPRMTGTTSTHLFRDMIPQVFIERRWNRLWSIRELNHSSCQVYISDTKESEMRESEPEVVTQCSHKKRLSSKVIEEPLNMLRSDKPQPPFMPSGLINGRAGCSGYWLAGSRCRDSFGRAPPIKNLRRYNRLNKLKVASNTFSE